MRKISVILFVLMVASLAFAIPASAHVLQSDGNIGAVMHIDPDDDPIALQPAYFFFDFKDKTGKFTPVNCTCVFSIEEAGKQIYSQPILKSDNELITFTFPQKDVYTVKVTGTPSPVDSFQPFTLKYDVRVSRAAASTSSLAAAAGPGNWFSTHVIHIVAVLGAVIIAIIVSLKRPKQPDKPQV